MHILMKLNTSKSFSASHVRKKSNFKILRRWCEYLPMPVPAGAISLEKISTASFCLWCTASQITASRGPCFQKSSNLDAEHHLNLPNWKNNCSSAFKLKLTDMFRVHCCKPQFSLSDFFSSISCIFQSAKDTVLLQHSQRIKYYN